MYEYRLLKALEAAPYMMPEETSGLAATYINTNDPNVLVVSNTQQLELLMNSFYEVLGVLPDKDFIEHTVRHEGQHEDAWRVLGAYAIKFGIRLYNLHANVKTVGYTPFIEVENIDTFSHLEKAAATAHPIDPSDGDVAQVTDLGFESVEEVAIKAMKNNRKGRSFIPVPLSYGMSSRIKLLNFLNIRR